MGHDPVDDRNSSSPYIHVYRYMCYTTRIPMLLVYIRSIESLAGFLSSTVFAQLRHTPLLPVTSLACRDTKPDLFYTSEESMYPTVEVSKNTQLSW